MIREFRLMLFVFAIDLTARLLPRDCVATWTWLRQIPYEK